MRQYLAVFPVPNPNESCYNLCDDIDCNVNNQILYLCSVHVTTDEIIQTINNMASNAAGGSDGIRSNILKAIKGSIAYPLSILFQKSIDEGLPLEIPYDTIIIPLLKPKLPRDLASSYRTIALCSQIIKVCEKNS